MQCPYCSADLGSKVVEIGEPTKAQARSREQHGRFFAMIAVAFEQWPEGFQELQPKSPDELRKWLTAKAGYVTTLYIEPPAGIISPDPEARQRAQTWMNHMIRQIQRAHEYSWVRPYRAGFAIDVPESVSFAKMTQHDFNNLSSRVDTILEYVGFDVRTLLSETDRRRAQHGPHV